MCHAVKTQEDTKRQHVRGVGEDGSQTVRISVCEGEMKGLRMGEEMRVLKNVRGDEGSQDVRGDKMNLLMPL